MPDQKTLFNTASSGYHSAYNEASPAASTAKTPPTVLPARTKTANQLPIRFPNAGTSGVTSGLSQWRDQLPDATADKPAATSKTTAQPSDANDAEQFDKRFPSVSALNQQWAHTSDTAPAQAITPARSADTKRKKTASTLVEPQHAPQTYSGILNKWYSSDDDSLSDSSTAGAPAAKKTTSTIAAILAKRGISNAVVQPPDSGVQHEISSPPASSTMAAKISTITPPLGTPPASARQQALKNAEKPNLKAWDGALDSIESKSHNILDYKKIPDTEAQHLLDEKLPKLPKLPPQAERDRNGKQKHSREEGMACIHSLNILEPYLQMAFKGELDQTEESIGNIVAKLKQGDAVTIGDRPTRTGRISKRDLQHMIRDFKAIDPAMNRLCTQAGVSRTEKHRAQLIVMLKYMSNMIYRIGGDALSKENQELGAHHVDTITEQYERGIKHLQGDIPLQRSVLGVIEHFRPDVIR